MWLQVAFDLPTSTKQERRTATQFSNLLLDNGFTMLHFSIYIRFFRNRSNAVRMIAKVKSETPVKGKIYFLQITDRQYRNLIVIEENEEKNGTETPKIYAVY